MSDALDLDAYLDRIQYGGDTRPGRETLSGLYQAHIERIPFENFDVLLGRPIRLDLEGVQRKLVRDRRGGYCFEHGTLFAAVLERLGFRPVRHSARVTLRVPRSEAARTHMLLTVPLPEGTFVADPGFGGLSPRRPVPVPTDDAPDDTRSSHTLVREGRSYVLRVRDPERTVDAWVSTLEPENAIDFAMGNHFTATHPASPFVNHVMLRAFSGEAMVTVIDRDVTLRGPGGTLSYQLPDRAALRALIAQHFGFDLPEIERLRVPAIPEWQ